MTNRPTVYFAEYSFEPDSLELRKNDRIVDLQPKQSQVLGLLIDNAGTVVERQTIKEQVWPEQVVEFDQSINFCIKCIRQVFSDDPRSPKIIQTVPRRGYRFIAEITHPLPASNETIQNDSIIEVPSTISSQSHNRPENISANSDGKLKHIPRLLLGSGLALIFAATFSLWWSDIGNAEKDFITTNNTSVVSGSNSGLERELGRALHLFNKSTFSGRKRSIDVFDQIIIKQPENAMAHAYLSMALSLTATSPDQFVKAREHAQLATYYPGAADEATMARALVAFYGDWNIIDAHSALLQVSTNQPRWPLVWHELAVTSAIVNDIELATKAIDNLLDLSPGVAQENYHAGWFYMIAGLTNEALKQCQQSVEINPKHAYGKLCAAQNAIQLGLHGIGQRYYDSFLQQLSGGEVSSTLSEHLAQQNYLAIHEYILQIQQQQNYPHFWIAISYMHLQQYDEAMAQLKLAIENHESMVPTAWAFSEFKPLHNDPNFIEVMSVVIR